MIHIPNSKIVYSTFNDFYRGVQELGERGLVFEAEFATLTITLI